MSGASKTVKEVAFKNPDGVLVAGMGVLIIAAACAGVVTVAVVVRSYDLATTALITLGFAGACALGVAFINVWRTPMLKIRPDALTIPTFFGQREISIKAGHPLGEYLASSHRSSRRTGAIESNKFVHFFTLDADDVLTELVALHRAAPVIAQIRSAFEDVAGLTVETLKIDAANPSRPDVAHWRKR